MYKNNNREQTNLEVAKLPKTQIPRIYVLSQSSQAVAAKTGSSFDCPTAFFKD